MRVGSGSRRIHRAMGSSSGRRYSRVRVWQDDPGVAALFNQYPLRSQQMVKPIDTAPLARTGSWKYRPMRPGQEYEEWVTRQITGYAADITGSGSLPVERAREAAVRSYEELLPRGLDTPGHSICVIEDHSAPVADIWLRHGHAAGLAYVFDVEVRPEHRGHGYGRAAVLVGEDVAGAGGDAFLGLNVFGHNHVAIRLYERMGYRCVEATRSIEL
jgi:GNAT superfamily N-acetyltransferase